MGFLFCSIGGRCEGKLGVIDKMVPMGVEGEEGKIGVQGEGQSENRIKRIQKWGYWWM